ncbi:DUF2247 family protein [Chitinophaga sp. sic0106]|uniref:DUF2247 family protein n=1 Tax=Chitinophaga sp. sic0106 TaxID=2854785 RepID=UPI001C44D34C|nr:DUF2247 family protein [Chitinophaga sp. sic0106]MBV7530991.1 DUF2247 family protein [Chitinophaga sp. sic0106]
MSKLIKSKIKLDWCIVDFGLSNGWVLPTDIAAAAYNGDFRTEIDESIIVELEIRKDDLKTFSSYISTLCDAVDDLRYRAIEVWGVIFLQEIVDSDKSIKEKLVDVEILWEKFDYPNEWEPFIYFLPAENGIGTGDDKVYSTLLEYLNWKKKQLEI